MLRYSRPLMKHLVLPSIAPALLVSLYLTPKHVFGCANRGLLALAVVFVALAAAISSASKSITEKRQGETEEANWWMLTTFILLSPLFLLVGPLG
jgi:hypothetical protein